MRRVRVERLPIDQLQLHRLNNDLIKDLLIDSCSCKTIDPIPADCRMIRHFAGQAKSEEPAIRSIDLYFFLQPSLGADTKQVSDKQHLKQHDRINRRTTVICTIQMSDFLVDKREVDRLVDLAQKMICGDKRFDANELQFRLYTCTFFQHLYIIQKALGDAQSFLPLSTVCSHPVGDSFATGERLQFL